MASTHLKLFQHNVVQQQCPFCLFFIHCAHVKNLKCHVFMYVIHINRNSVHLFQHFLVLVYANINAVTWKTTSTYLHIKCVCISNKSTHTPQDVGVVCRLLVDLIDIFWSQYRRFHDWLLLTIHTHSRIQNKNK